LRATGLGADEFPNRAAHGEGTGAVPGVKVNARSVVRKVEENRRWRASRCPVLALRVPGFGSGAAFWNETPPVTSRGLFCQ